MVKLRYSEKGTKFEKNLPLTCFDVYSVTSKKVGDFFQIVLAFSEI